MDNKKQEPVNLAEFLSKMAKELEERDKAIAEGRLLVLCGSQNTLSEPVSLTQVNLTGLWQKDCFGMNSARYVSVRPCGEEYGNKTYLGVLIGSCPIQLLAEYRADTESIIVSKMSNPLIFVPDIMGCVWGAGSFWSPITSTEDLKQITDADINGAWYVRVLKELVREGAEENADAADKEVTPSEG